MNASPTSNGPAGAGRGRLLSRTWIALLSWSAQFLLALLGAVSLFDASLTILQIWSIVASLYLVVAVVSLTAFARTEPEAPAPEENLPRWFGRLRGLITIFLTVVPATIGVVSAVNVVIFRDNAAIGPLVKLPGVWAMLLAWIFLHWGFAQIYAYRADAARPQRILDFPNTERPILIDHIYFSFTIGTTFAASDVDVLTPRARWLVTVHSTLSFFMNALIIALSFNVILAAGK